MAQTAGSSDTFGPIPPRRRYEGRVLERQPRQAKMPELAAGGDAPHHATHRVRKSRSRRGMR